MNALAIPAFVPSFLLMVGILSSAGQPSAAAEHLVGGYSEVSTTNEQVIAAARFAAKTAGTMPERNGDGAPVVLQSIDIGLVDVVEAQQQVVAGMNYRRAFSSELASWCPPPGETNAS